MAAGLITMACSGYDPYTGFEGPPSLPDLGFPDPGVEMTRTFCSLHTSGEGASGTVVYRARADADQVAEAFLSSGEPSDRVVDRGSGGTGLPEATGQVEVVRLGQHREVAVVPLEDGVEVIAFLSEVPGDWVGCGSSITE